MPTTVLVVDDKHHDASLIEANLAGAGYGVAKAYNRADAVLAARITGVDLIILDIVLPAGDGFQVIEELREETPTAHIPIMIVSADPQPEDADRAFELGVFGFLAKPFAPCDLLDMVARAFVPAPC